MYIIIDSIVIFFSLLSCNRKLKKLAPKHPIIIALKRAKAISKDLRLEFGNYLGQYDDWEGQALYLLEDKGESIEKIIEDLFDVPLDDQPTWKRPKATINFEENAPVDIPPPPTTTSKSAKNDSIQFSFKDWKQEHGFDTIPIEVGDIHTIIRFEHTVTPDLEEKFIWSFNRSRYGIRGWGNEKPIKKISKSLLDNNNNPGWVVKTFLDENKLICDEEHNLRKPEDEIPNPCVLSSRDSHSLLFLLLGHPFLYYGDSQLPLRNSFKKVEYEIQIHELANHRVLAGVFFHIDGDVRMPIVAEEFDENGFMMFGLPKAIIYDYQYYEILPTTIPAKMIRNSFNGILVPHDEWDEFKTQMSEWYPEHSCVYLDSKVVESPNFEARKVREWKYWLYKPEGKIQLFEKPEDAARVQLHEETKHFNTNRMAMVFENHDPENSRLINSNASPKTAKLFQVMSAITKGKMMDGFYPLERHQASQLLILAEEYPYTYSYNGLPLYSPKAIEFRLTVKRNPKNDNQYVLRGEIGVLNEKKRFQILKEKDNFREKAIGMAPCFLLKDDQLCRIGSMLSGRLLNDSLAGVVVEEHEISDFYSAALPYLKQRNIKIHDPQGVLRVSALFNYKIQGRMTIWEVKGVLMGRMDVIMVTDIGEYSYPYGVNADEFTQELDKKQYNVPKDLAQEHTLRNELVETGWVDEGMNEYSMREDMSMQFVLGRLTDNHPENIVVYLGGAKLRKWKTRSLVPEIATSIKSGVDWFDVDVSVTIDGQLYDLKKLVEMWHNNEDAIQLQSGNGIAVIDSTWIEKYAPILNRLVQTSKGKKPVKGEEDDQIEHLQVDRFQVGLLSELEAVATISEHDEDWVDVLEKLSNFKKIRMQRIPKEVNAVLRDYQREGVNWLCFLHEFGFGGILADDMGLGKTLQTLAFLMIIKKKHRSKLPNLVIAPTSVVTNWMAEVRKFTPDLNAVLLHGQKRKNHYESALKADLIITTYGLLQRDMDWLGELEFQVVILDEAQNIKNARSKTAQAVMQLHAHRRLTLTGTPIENSVSELWSQFNFLMPGFFGTLKEFERDYIRPKKRGKNKVKKPNHSLLRRQTKPFILRRLKQNVAKELPPKTQQTLYCEMNDHQKSLYYSVMEVVRQQVKEKISAGGVRGARIAIFDALLKLRQICNDPRLSSLAGTDPPPSAKYKLFIETLTEIVGEGHRVLVFSQFVKMLNLMHEDLKKEGIPFLQLDGTSKNREDLVNKFQQSDEYPVFLISLKAGGTGINLTAADYVIHYDPWWNPAAESQATDRAYRIGQKNHLFVYKLITRNSIEEKIIELQNKKQALADNIVGVNDSLEDMLNMDDLNDLFAI